MTISKQTRDRNNSTTTKVSAPAAKKEATEIKEHIKMKTIREEATRTIEQEGTIFAMCARRIWKKLRKNSIHAIANIKYVINVIIIKCKSKRGNVRIVENIMKLVELKNTNRVGWFLAMKGRMRVIGEACNKMIWCHQRKVQQKKERVMSNMWWNGKLPARSRKLNWIKRKSNKRNWPIKFPTSIKTFKSQKWWPQVKLKIKLSNSIPHLQKWIF